MSPLHVLLLVHGFPPSAWGGTEVYTATLARTISETRGDRVSIVTREADPARPEYAVRREQRDRLEIFWINNTFRACRSFEETYRQPAIAGVIGALLDELRPDVAHIQHLTCLSTDAVSELARRSIPALFTLNDFWLICHRGQLLDLDYQRCRGPYGGGCTRCTGAHDGVAPGAFAAARLVRALERRGPNWATTIARRAGLNLLAHGSTEARSARETERRLSHMQQMSRAVALFLAPSRTLEQQFLEFGLPADRLRYQTQGIDRARLRGLERTTSARLRLAFLGSLMISKAPDLLLRAFDGLSPEKATLSIFGGLAAYHGDERYGARLEPLLQQPGLHYAGPVQHDQVPGVLASTDVLVMPSIWLENAPFVIKEAFAAGVPVVASRLGGMAELVSDGRNGLLFEPGNAADLRRCLLRLLEEPGLLAQLRAGLPEVKDIGEDAEETRSLYLRYAGRRPPVSEGTAAGPAACQPPGPASSRA